MAIITKPTLKTTNNIIKLEFRIKFNKPGVNIIDLTSAGASYRLKLNWDFPIFTYSPSGDIIIDARKSSIKNKLMDVNIMVLVLSQ